MVAAYAHAVYDLNPRASSIDTPLHAFIPFKHVDHTHPNAVIALAAAKDGERLMREIYGDEVAWLPWQRPGFDLGLALARTIEERPGIKGIILGQHGLINWADDDKACYELSLRLIEQAARAIEERDKGAKTFGGLRYQPLPEERRDAVLAEVLPTLRGMVSQQKRFIGTVQSDGPVVRGSSTASTHRGWRSSGRRAPITSCGPRSSRCTSTGTRSGSRPRLSSRSCAPAWSATAPTTPPTTRRASTTTRPRCATPTPR